MKIISFQVSFSNSYVLGFNSSVLKILSSKQVPKAISSKAMESKDAYSNFRIHGEKYEERHRSNRLRV